MGALVFIVLQASRLHGQPIDVAAVRRLHHDRRRNSARLSKSIPRKPIMSTRRRGPVYCVKTPSEEKLMSTLERAIEIAARSHAGQMDKGGEPYILHPMRVMLGVRTLPERMAAALHDVVEDTPVTLDDLRAEGFAPEVVDAVDCLTKREGEKRMDAAARAKRNPIARAVKLSDLADNMDKTRIANPTERDAARLKEYEAVRAFLLAD
jgi:GTP diphosphokinase / guanosine-3',5'-bis(diphosphate) 3'-diphosphatase